MPRPLVDENGLMRYRASKLDCDACALKPRCCPNAPARKILRSIHEGARDMARDIATTDAYVTSRRQRKKVEMLFAHLKRILKLDRLRLRGPNGARDEFHLAAAAQNLRKLAKLIPMPTQTGVRALGLRSTAIAKQPTSLPPGDFFNNIGAKPPSRTLAAGKAKRGPAARSQCQASLHIEAKR